MEKLAVETIANIFDRLPIEAALHAKHVCKSWKSALCNYTSHRVGFFFTFRHEIKRSNNLGKELFYGDEYDHYDHENINYYHTYQTLGKQHDRFITESVPSVIRVIGSCNGLVCFSKYNTKALSAHPFLICNPSTGESVFLPEFIYYKLPGGVQISYKNGFGYCPSTNEYKVVSIRDHPKEHQKHAQVYTIGGGGGWRYIRLVDRDNHYRLDYISGVNANGALHWLHQSDPKVQNYEVGVFDLKEEKFRYISVPRFEDSEYESWNTLSLELLGGNNVNLYLVHKNYKASRMDMWLYKGRSCWNKQFSITLRLSHMTPFAITKNNQVLFWHMRSSTPTDTRLCCYDIKTSTVNELWDDNSGMKGDYIMAVPHTQSIVSLRGLGETDVTCLKDLEKQMSQAAASKDCNKRG